MGFRCPICSKDFGRNRQEWQEHSKSCCDGAADDVVNLVLKAAEGTEPTPTEVMLKRDKLEMYLGKEVMVTMWDGETTIGILIKGAGHEKNKYQCGDGFWFRSSHVTKIKETTYVK